MVGTDQDLFTRLAVAARQQPELVLAVVFGSVARGGAHAGSDVDIGVVLDGADVSRRGAIEAELGRAAGREIDFVDLGGAPPLLRFEIARDGLLLFERAPYVWADFRAHAMIDWWDWAPTARKIHHAAAARLRRQVSDGSS